MKPYICIVDCRVDTEFERDFFKLCIWGKYVFEYPIDEAIKAGIFKTIYILTESEQVTRLVSEKYGEKVRIAKDWLVMPPLSIPFVLLSGRAVLIKKGTLIKAVDAFDGNTLISAKNANVLDFKHPYIISFLAGNKPIKTNAFAIFNDDASMKNYDESRSKEYLLKDSEALVINSTNDFELAIILLKKANQQMAYEEIVLNRIEEKKYVLQNSTDKHSVCFIGHSQLDYWEIDNLGGHSVRNCGIMAIDSKQYYDYILVNGHFCYDSDYFVFMLGTNDIVSDLKLSEIVQNIKRVVKRVMTSAHGAKLIFLSCAHVLGRMDRDNKMIDNLNEAVKKELGDWVTWVDTSSLLDDNTGNIAQCNTIDGLHLSDVAYEKLQAALEDVISNA